jgi:hypothetical protein
VHALPSSHDEPLALAGFEHVPLAGSHVPAVWHWSDAAQTFGLIPMQTPAWQLSLAVQALPSLHDVPLALAGFEHIPVDALHVPASWHWSDAMQTTGGPAVQVPPWQVSLAVHPLPSSQAAPLPLAGFEHVPLAGSHVPVVLQWSL